MKVRLPIVLDAMIMSDCCTYNRIAIIQTSPHAQAWLSTHMKMFVEDDFGAWHGFVDTIFTMDYYKEILSFQEINTWEFPPDKIVAMIKDQINQKNYIEIELNFSENAFVNRHEALLFGYDDVEKVFYTSMFDRPTRKFQERTLSFDFVEKSYAEVFAYYQSNPEQMVNTQMKFFNINRISLKDTFDEDGCFFTAVLKLDEERHGKCFAVTLGENVTSRSYMGVRCLLGIEENLKEILSREDYDNANLRNLYWTSNKLYEYRTILLLTMRWLIKNLEAPNEEILAASAEYEKCCEDFKKIRNLLLKYQQGHDEKILHRVQKKLKLQYDHEKNALSKFLDHAFPLYVQQKTYENYKNRTQKQNGKVAEIR